MKKTKPYEGPRIVRVMPLFLEKGVCNSSVFTGDSSVSSNAQYMIDWKDGNGPLDIDSSWKY